jgi:hypothetical protein
VSRPAKGSKESGPEGSLRGRAILHDELHRPRKCFLDTAPMAGTLALGRRGRAGPDEPPGVADAVDRCRIRLPQCLCA